MFLEHEGLGIVALPPWLSFDPDVAIEPSAVRRQREFSQSLRRIDDAFADRWIDLLDLLHPVDQGRELRVQGKERRDLVERHDAGKRLPDLGHPDFTRGTRFYHDRFPPRTKT
jgi:hypothetical protein